MKVVGVILFLVIVVIAWLAGAWIIDGREREAASASAPGPEIRTEKDRCMAQPGQAYRDLGHNSETTLQTYYNTGLSKCFLIASFANVTSKSRVVGGFLLDLDTKRIYAEYADNGRSVMTCWLNPLSDDQTFCYSQTEYNDFVARYLE